ncbi:DUF3099 domain-containing protein [Actinoplanes sp. KI2]|uniref:DUF3099 domain-containing protein n=1 Tax=Actinoplanes sp. KI2 TaxID=2983315 RepID=UPI0021D608CE|nr:DUF3099 domain-containing protein [Actinoplanes sp. KI2]MCU7731208.1 DUF3099 domain-containing protein [Actinoplanes sp. KI2]
MKKQPERPVLITDAARSQDEQFRSRQIRYVTMMGLRAGCLIAGAILISANPPLLPVWLVICALGMVILPWAAVLIANDRPARSKAERAAAAAAREQEHQAALSQYAPEEVEYLTIDAEPVEGETAEGERWSATQPERERKRR